MKLWNRGVVWQACALSRQDLVAEAVTYSLLVVLVPLKMDGWGAGGCAAVPATETGAHNGQEAYVHPLASPKTHTHPWPTPHKQCEAASQRDEKNYSLIAWESPQITFLFFLSFSPENKNKSVPSEFRQWQTGFVCICFCLFCILSFGFVLQRSGGFPVFCLVWVSSVCLLVIWARTHPESVSHSSVISGSLAVSVNLPSLLVFWEIPAATLFA